MNELEKRHTGLVFSTSENFDHYQRMAKGLAQSDMIPKGYQNNIPNVLIALDIANQMQTSPLTVMQNMDVIHGKPSWSSKYIIGLLKSYPKLKHIVFNKVGKKGSQDWGYYVTAVDTETGATLEGTTVDMQMATAEGWVNKSGSKWKTMPELMLQYRAAAFFCRINAPEILFGFHTSDEIQDINASTPSNGSGLSDKYEDADVIPDDEPLM